MANNRYLLHRTNKRIFEWTEVQAKNTKFVECTKSGLAVSTGANPEDITAILAEKDKKIRELEREKDRLSIYALELEAQVRSYQNPRVEREKELRSLSRKQLMAAAASKNIDNAPVKFKKGKEPELILFILDMEFPGTNKE